MTDHAPSDTPAQSPIIDSSTSTRIVLDCTVCGAGITLPNKGLGRATAATWPQPDGQAHVGGRWEQ